MAVYSYKIKTIGNACIIRYDRGEGPDLKTIIDANYSTLTDAERVQVTQYVQSPKTEGGAGRPDIPYDITQGA